MTQSIEDRVITETEQIHTVSGGQLVLGPGRDGEQVAALDAVLGTAQPHRSAPGKDLPHAGTDLAPGLADRAGPQPVELGPDRRHDIAARGGIAEPHRRMTGAYRGRVPLTFDLQLLGKSPIGVLPPVRRDRRTLPFTQQRDGLQARMSPQPLGAGSAGRAGIGQRVGAVGEEPTVGLLDGGDVEAVQPRHGRVSDVLMAVEMLAWREQTVATLPRHAVAVYDC